MRTIVLLIVFVCLGGLILFLKKYTGKNARRQIKPETTTPVTDTECCGAHEICEKTGKYNPQFKPDYYDDEELDAYKGVSPDDYSEAQTAEFEDVLMTMKEEDVAGWLRSLQLRGIELPYSVRDKAIMILNQNS